MPYCNTGPEIYIATNRKTGRQYVGQTNNFGPRLSAHRNQRGSVSYFTRAIQSHGPDDFMWVHVPCPKEQLDAWESFFIQKLGTMVPAGYNLTSGGESKKIISEETRLKISVGNRGKTVSPESRAKMSAAKKGIWPTPEHQKKMQAARAMLPNPMLGKHHSDEARAKISSANSGNKYWLGKKHSQESIEKMRAVKIGKKTWTGKHHTEETKEKIRQCTITQRRGPHGTYI
jgi:group I intron endonuclease